MNLPKYFVIKKCDNPLWSKYINWLNKTYDEKCAGNLLWYYGFDGMMNYYSDLYYFRNEPTLLTLEQWDECVNKLTLQDEFIVDMRNEPVITYENLENQRLFLNDSYSRDWDYIKYPLKFGYIWEHTKKHNDFNDFPHDLPIITYKQFLEMQTKIIGYKAPMDLYDGTIKKGSLYTKMGTSFFSFYYYLGSYGIPKEIVETWEPVYEIKEVVVEIGTPKKIVTIKKEHFECEGVSFGKLTIQSFLDRMINSESKIHNWAITYPQVKIGRSTFTIEEITSLLHKQSLL